MSTFGQNRLILLLGISTVLFQIFHLTFSKDQYVMPMATGMKMSISYDIANIFNVRPIASVTAIVLSILLLVVLFLGIITAPFGYFLGIPSRKYVLGGNSTSRHLRSLFDDDSVEGSSPFTYLNWNLNEDKFIHQFESNAYYFIPSEISANVGCGQLLICYAHSALHHLPKWILRFYHLYSRKQFEINQSTREAILLGITNREKCSSTFHGCPDSIFSLVIKSFRHLLPEFLKNRPFHRRKQPMYM